MERDRLEDEDMNEETEMLTIAFNSVSKCAKFFDKMQDVLTDTLSLTKDNGNTRRAIVQSIEQTIIERGV
jgi:hypothetical protein